jgi:hypothetical protein
LEAKGLEPDLGERKFLNDDAALARISLILFGNLVVGRAVEFRAVPCWGAE